jgi:uncharacterized protein
MRPIVLITGASAGIGAELAHVFAAHELVLVARREDRLRALADEIVAGGRRRPEIVTLDLQQPDCGPRIAQVLAARQVEPRYVVNNAGFGLIGSSARLDRHEQLAMVDLNVRTLTDLSLTFLESLTHLRGGILNVASLAGFLPGPGMAVYYATKAYVLSFSQALHQELKPRGVTVTALCPGPVPTEFQARAGVSERQDLGWLSMPADRVAREAFDGLMRGRRVVLPGVATKMVSLLPRILGVGAILRIAAARQRRRATSTAP